MTEEQLENIKKFSRGWHGLLENKEYIFNEDASVNWRAMINADCLYPNKDWFISRQKEIPTSIEGLDDKQLLINLSGIKEIARIRGFSRVDFSILRNDDEYVIAKCRIVWLPNYETDNREVVFEEVANATFNNTDAFGCRFLEAIACNRAFIRCVRNFLGIYVVGADEVNESGNTESLIPANKEESNDLSFLKPYGMLEKAAKDFGLNTFEEFSSKLKEFKTQEKYTHENSEKWKSYKDVPAKECRIISKLLNSTQSNSAPQQKNDLI